MLGEGHFGSARGLVSHGQVVIAVLAIERAAARDFDGYIHRRAFPGEALMNPAAKLPVINRLHLLPCVADAKSVKPISLLTKFSVRPGTPGQPAVPTRFHASQKGSSGRLRPPVRA